MPQNDIECESFTVIFIDSLLVFENKYDLNNCAYKIANKQITDCRCRCYEIKHLLYD